MCSNCSGDYAGGFEPPENAPTDRDELDKRARDQGSEDGLRFERASFQGSRGESPEADSAGNSRRPEAAIASESCQILVSATRIVEVRVIEADLHDFTVLGETERSQAATARKHSTAESAKYYQTRRDRRAKGGGAVQLRLAI